MKTTLTSVRQYMTEIDNSANAISDAVKHLQRHMSDNALITEDAQYFLDTISKYANRIKEGFGE